jgi:hypothetical protein
MSHWLRENLQSVQNQTGALVGFDPWPERTHRVGQVLIVIDIDVHFSRPSLAATLCVKVSL